MYSLDGVIDCSKGKLFKWHDEDPLDGTFWLTSFAFTAFVIGALELNLSNFNAPRKKSS